ncbi:hypothetical protein RI543_003667 [Arxiozyma heterogenica]|uniref:Uncharacterized protein n=1 Tax=Arxiozyma heterogenica TaxID=278026 RepID=A0AAN7W0C7_9SACH|nr:hypothetical protein RI543_003667 [Kazachstania heterogenica]
MDIILTRFLLGSASALSSYISYVTDSNGSTKAIGVIVVETPAVSQITSYIPGLVASASPLSTSTSYTTNSDGSSSPIDIVIVATPSIAPSSLGYHYWNSSSTSTAFSYSGMAESSKENTAATRNTETAGSNNWNTNKAEPSLSLSPSGMAESSKENTAATRNTETTGGNNWSTMKIGSSSRTNGVETEVGSLAGTTVNPLQVAVTQEPLHVSSQTAKPSGRSSAVTLSQYEASAPTTAAKWSSFALAFFSLLPFIF